MQKGSRWIMSVFPFMQIIDGKRFLVVGSGIVARRKIRLLLQFTEHITVITHPLKDHSGTQWAETAGELASFSDKGAEILCRRFVPEDLEKADYCIASSDDKNLNHSIAVFCHTAGIPVNVPDNPADCTFFMPSVIKKGPLVISVSTGGASPAMSAEIRRRIEDLLPENTEVILDRMEELRTWVPQEVTSSQKRGMLYRELLCALLEGRLEPREEEVRAAVQAWMDADTE